jgi:hypothetical protein
MGPAKEEEHRKGVIAREENAAGEAIRAREARKEAAGHRGVTPIRALTRAHRARLLLSPRSQRSRSGPSGSIA